MKYFILKPEKHDGFRGTLKAAKRFAKRTGDSVWVYSGSDANLSTIHGVVHAVPKNGRFDFGLISAFTGTFYSRGISVRIRDLTDRISRTIYFQSPIVIDLRAWKNND